MTISKYYSSKITILNTALIMMVLYIHGYYLEGEQYHVALAVQRFFSGNAFCGIANRLFFVLSGMLFFNGIDQLKDCFTKMKRRVRTILVPYLIWNCIFVGWYFMLKIIPGVDSFVNSDVSDNFDTLWHGINFLWIKPASFPLWFLRDLICFIVFSPLIYLFLKYLKFWGVLALVAIEFFIPIYGFWFILGGCVSMNCDLDRLHKLISLPIVIFSSIVFLFGCIYICIQSVDYYTPQALDVIMAFTGMIMVWNGYDYVARGQYLKEGSFWALIMGYSFFIYLFHEPTFNIIKKIPVRVFGDSELVIIFFFIVNPIIMAIVAICVAKCLQRFVPKVYSILVGGR